MNKENEEIELYSTIYELEINQICAILDENDIPYMRKDYDIGSYMNVYFGQSNKEKKIFVLKNNYEKAKELTSYIISNFNKNADNEDNEDDDNNKYNLIKKLFKIYILGGILIVIVIFIIALITQT